MGRWKVPALAMVLACGCAFLEGALEITFGEGKVPEIEIVALLPTLDQLGLELDPYEDTPGVPATLDSLTLAHVRGALRLAGQCSRSSRDAVVAADAPDDGTEVQVHDCDPARCPDACPAGATGVRVQVAFPARLVTADQATQLRDALAKVSPDSILQFRIKAWALDVIAPGPGVTADAWAAAAEDAAAGPVPGERLTDAMSSMDLRAQDALGNSVVIIRREWLDSIAPDSPQRFDIDIDSGFCRQVKQQVLAGEAVDMAFVVDAVVPTERLYRFPLGAALVGLRAQPEFVISVLRAALSRI